VAEEMGLTSDLLEPYGRHVMKVSLDDDGEIIGLS
jgi:formyltetrahydrofolate synthetase